MELLPATFTLQDAQEVRRMLGMDDADCPITIITIITAVLGIHTHFYTIFAGIKANVAK